MASEERLKVLKMVQEGKISAEDAIELLSILEEGRRRPPVPPAPPPGIGRRDNRWLRVRVTDTNSGKTRVNVRLPISMVSAGVKMGMRFAPNVEGIDADQLMELIQSVETGQIVDVHDEEDGEHVEVFIE
ncbi:MAG TPA: hypothetical protein VLH85_10520 [Levilinea sp.]|nr:hypothetical protein [Levilinea sp.]